jgi:hypothetical protein
MKKLRALWQSVWVDVDRRIRLGRLLGLTFVTAGFVVIGKAWDGAASKNFVQGQFPYLLSGGFMGLGLIITGCTLLFLATARSERKILTDQYEDMVRLLGRNLSRLQLSTNGSGAEADDTAGTVVAGANAYHRAGCKILQGKDGLMTVSIEQASAEGLAPCRVCEPPRAQEKTSASA